MIVVGALGVFAKKGFEAASSRELAAAAGVSEALIYKYFPTKEALYQELAGLLRKDKDQLLAKVTASTPGTAGCVRALHFIGRMMLFGPPGRPADDSVDRLIGQSLLGDGTFAAAFLENLFYPALPYLADCLQAAWLAGDLEGHEAPSQPQCVLFHHFIGSLALFSLPSRSLVPFEDREQLFREALMFGLRGLGLSQAALSRNTDFSRLYDDYLNITQGEHTS